MYFDGLAKEVTNDVMFYADDTSIFATHKDNIDFAQKSLQDELSAASGYEQNG